MTTTKPASRATQQTGSALADPASYRDPSGFVFWRDGNALRQINRRFADEWNAFSHSGLYRELVSARLLIPHEDLPLAQAATADAVAVIKPLQLAFISYPYEWPFDLLKDAALATLDIQERCLRAGFILKDASAYNIQLVDGRPMLIDSLSIEPWKPGSAWVGYRQFCEHFLAPLALMALRDIPASLLREYLDGVPLDLASRVLPARTRLSVGLGAHLHLHARAQSRHSADSRRSQPQRSMSLTAHFAMVDSLRKTVKRLAYRDSGSTWADYANNNSYSDQAASAKGEIVQRWTQEANPRVLWDLGANTGRYSDCAASASRQVIALDSDAVAVNHHYRDLRRRDERNVLPLLQDLANPSPALGWDGEERRSLMERANADLVLALAVVHHLAIGRNVPLPLFASFLAKLAPRAIVEFVPKSDAMVQRLLAHREDVFDDYSAEGFRAALENHFDIVAAEPLPQSERQLFLLARR